MPTWVLYTYLWSVSSFLFFADNEGVDRDEATDTFEVMEAGGEAIIGDIVGQEAYDHKDEGNTAVIEEVIMDERLIEEKLKDPPRYEGIHFSKAIIYGSMLSISMLIKTLTYKIKNIVPSVKVVK